jgi:hypothetical protein
LLTNCPNCRCLPRPVDALLSIPSSKAGLSPAAADRVYRSLYVYSVGFGDTLREALAHSQHRAELLQALWRAFLALAEAALQVGALHSCSASIIGRASSSAYRAYGGRLVSLGPDQCWNSSGSGTCEPSASRCAIRFTAAATKERTPPRPPCPARLQVGFKSEWLSLAGAASAAMGELLATKEALAEVGLPASGPSARLAVVYRRAAAKITYVLV